jgi:hypothetical protein
MRALAVVAAIGLLLCAAYNLLLIVFFGAVSLAAPDPTIIDGDPCCGHPDTWGEVAFGLMWTFGFVVVEGLILGLVCGLVGYAASGRWPAWRRLALVPVVTVAVAAVAIAVPLLPLLDEGRKQLP